MKIHECLLDGKNDFAAVGAMVSAAGKEHLWDERKAGLIDTVVIHYMSAVNAAPDDPYDLGRLLKIFCDCGVSCHYLIDRGGKVFRLVPEGAKAWHCGGSVMPEPDNRVGVNEFSIGVELAATENSGFTEPQYASLSQLCVDIERRRGVKMNYVGHDQIAGERAVNMGLRGDRKTDPGPLFRWERFLDGIARVRKHPV